MSRDLERDRRRVDQNEELAADIHDAMRSLGWTVPTCVEDVLRAEADLAASPSPLPAELQDAKAVFERPDESPGADVVLPFGGDADIDATLARAAREAGHITPEIEQAMRRDRQAAQQERDDAQADQ
jgi:hypothetical protein